MHRSGGTGGDLGQTAGGCCRIGPIVTVQGDMDHAALQHPPPGLPWLCVGASNFRVTLLWLCEQLLVATSALLYFSSVKPFIICHWYDRDIL